MTVDNFIFRCEENNAVYRELVLMANIILTVIRNFN